MGFALGAIVLSLPILGASGTVSLAALAGAGPQGVGQTPSQFPLSQPIRERGSSVTGAYEGWYRNKDGSVSLLVGYFNRNTKQELDIPVGPNNRIEPGGPDQGQPTHFLTSRQWGVFSIKVPADFVARLEQAGVRTGTIDARTFRVVTHKDVDDDDIAFAIGAFDDLVDAPIAERV